MFTGYASSMYFNTYWKWVRLTYFFTPVWPFSYFEPVNTITHHQLHLGPPNVHRICTCAVYTKQFQYHIGVLASRILILTCLSLELGSSCQRGWLIGTKVLDRQEDHGTRFNAGVRLSRPWTHIKTIGCHFVNWNF